MIFFKEFKHITTIYIVHFMLCLFHPNIKITGRGGGRAGEGAQAGRPSCRYHMHRDTHVCMCWAEQCAGRQNHTQFDSSEPEHHYVKGNLNVPKILPTSA